MARIRPLPPDAASQIHSSKHITSVNSVVWGLFENSLDADATKIDIVVDYARGSCTVEDNGNGIKAIEFHEDGGLGKLYHSSKWNAGHRSACHGSTGTFLASLAALSLLEVTSRHETSSTHSRVIWYNGRRMAEFLDEPFRNSFACPLGHGTHVAVRDLFGNMPVRVKQRALSADDARDWHHLSRGIVALLVAWARPCKVKLKDANAATRDVTLCILDHDLNYLALTTGSLRRLRSHKSYKFELHDVLPVLYQSGLAPPESRSQWIPTTASSAEVVVKGLICLDPAPTKHCQFISIGVQPCLTGESTEQSILYDAINRIFANSSFGAVDQDMDRRTAATDIDSEIRPGSRKSRAGPARPQPGKGVDRWPRFVLQITLPQDSSLDPGSSSTTTSDALLAKITNVLEATVTHWLVKHHFRPRTLRRRKNESQESPAGLLSLGVPAAIASIDASNEDDVTHPRTSLGGCARGHLVTTKKRRLLDPQGRPVVGDNERPPRSAGSYFDSLSRIKSGRRGLDDNMCRQIKSACGPETQARSTGAADNTLSISANDSASRSALMDTEKPAQLGTTAGVLPARNAQKARVDNLASEDFGSPDDAALLELVEVVEQNRGTGAESPSLAELDVGPTGQDDIISWIDPANKEVLRINTRTGMAVESRPKPDPDHRSTRARIAMHRVGDGLGRLRRLTANSGQSENSDPWLPGFLKDWDNPVFSRQQEERIPSISFTESAPPVSGANVQCCNHDEQAHRFFEQKGTTGPSRISRPALQNAEVIKQVDNKFILCKMALDGFDSATTSLVMVDQHAVSERVILERLLEELCTPLQQNGATAAFAPSLGVTSQIRTTLLERPFVRFSIPTSEAELFRLHCKHFAAWGIIYDLEQRRPTTMETAAEEATGAKAKKSKLEWLLTVRSLPPSISERCTQTPSVLIDLLRTEVWLLAESSRSHRGHAPSKRDGNQDQDWLSRIGSCPKGILDLLNSRACRSAIMFNDVLDVNECRRLLSELAWCRFPFICAHGRVSMVPVARLGGSKGAAGVLVDSDESLGLESGGFGGAVEGRPDGFVDAFKRWEAAG